VPAQQFWSLTLYDRETCGFIRDMPRTGVDSYDQKMQRNADGSVDIYIGPKPPAWKESNWIQTASGRDWFPYFRLYGPEKTFFDKTWKLPEIEKGPEKGKLHVGVMGGEHNSTLSALVSPRLSENSRHCPELNARSRACRTSARRRTCSPACRVL
jgi:hypothetical protein